MRGCIASLFAAVLVGCGGDAKKEAAVPDEPAMSAGLANPASVRCLEAGGRLVMMEEAAGVFGVCEFGDGSRCDEWRFFRGECVAGACRREDGRCDPV